MRYNLRKINVKQQPNKKVMRTTEEAYIIMRRLIMKTNQHRTLQTVLEGGNWAAKMEPRFFFLNKYR